jgi:hypothetical protein
MVMSWLIGAGRGRKGAARAAKKLNIPDDEFHDTLRKSMYI